MTALNPIDRDLPTNLPPCQPPTPHPLPSYWTKNYSSFLTKYQDDKSPPSHADVVIIGSGLTGSCTAARLVDELLLSRSAEEPNGPLESCTHETMTMEPQDSREVKVVVLEARDFCSGATGRNGGHLTAYPRLNFDYLKTEYGVDGAMKEATLEDRSIRWILDECQKEGWVDQVDLVTGGNVHLFDGEEDTNFAKIQLDAATEAGLDMSAFRWLSASEALEKYGADVYAALLIPGNNLYPLKFVTCLFERAMDRAKKSNRGRVSLDLFTHTLVEKVEDYSKAFCEKEEQAEDRDWVFVENKDFVQTKERQPRWRLRTSKGSMTASCVVHATNAYTSYLIPSLSKGPQAIVPCRGQVIAYDPSSASPSSSPRLRTEISDPHWTTGFSAPHSSEYFFQRPPNKGGEIILGGAREQAGFPWEFGNSDDGSINERVGEELKRYLRRQFPMIFPSELDQHHFDGSCSNNHVKQEWTGIMAYTAKAVPLFGHVFLDGECQRGQYISAGYSGHGMPRAPACGEALAKMVYEDLCSRYDPDHGESDHVQPPDWIPNHFLSKAEDSCSIAPESQDSTKPLNKDVQIQNCAAPHSKSNERYCSIM